MTPPSNTLQPRSSRLHYGILLGLVFFSCGISYIKIWGSKVDPAAVDAGDGQRRLGFLDAKRAPTQPYGRIMIDQNYQSLLHPSAIDSSLFRTKKKQDESACDNVFLFLPQSFAHMGHGAQLNNYLLAAMIATFTNRAMVMLEAPPSLNEFKSNSQFGCPPEAFEKVMVRTGAPPKVVGWNEEFPNGLSRLIKHPPWLSRQCPVPCQGTHSYEDWDKASHAPLEIKCTNSDTGRESNVIAMGGQQVRDYFAYHYKDYMVDRSAPESVEAATSDTSTLKMSYEWALRLGAATHEARLFSGLQDKHEIWDYVSAFMARSGVIRFHPWIARDVEELIARSDLPLDAPYDAIHVRRGDNLASELERFVALYWDRASKEKGGEGGMKRLISAFGPERDQKPLPQDYIPFVQYLRQFEDVKCNADGKPRIVYVATDDPTEVQSEINELPKDSEGNTLLTKKVTKKACHKFKFVFSSFDPSIGFHIETDSAKGDCEERYARNVASIADLMILAKSDVLVGEFVSSWGRLVRTFRLKMGDIEALEPGTRPVSVREMKIAVGHQHPGPPGW